MDPYYVANPFDSIRARVGIAPAPPPKNNCSDGAFEQDIDYYNQNQQTSHHASSVGECCALCAASATCKAYTLFGSTCWMKANADGRRAKTGAQSGVCKKDPTPPSDDCHNGICVKYLPSSATDFTTLADADLAIVFVGTSSSEGGDRGNLGLSNEDALINNVAKIAGKKTIVVAVTPGALLTPWRDAVGAVLTPFMPGQEYGNAITEVLFGDANPGGRLPITFPKIENEMNFTEDMYPGTGGISVYSEALEVGYRWYNAHSVTPAFGFGHGLTFSTFQYSDLKIEGRSISCKVTNSGDRNAIEVPQLYLGFPAVAKEPPKQLKGFQKVHLKAGESTSVTFKLTDRDLSVWDTSEAQWSVVEGDFDVMVGSSSEDILLTGKLGNTAVVTV